MNSNLVERYSYSYYSYFLRGYQISPFIIYYYIYY